MIEAVDFQMNYNEIALNNNFKIIVFLSQKSNFEMKNKKTQNIEVLNKTQVVNSKFNGIRYSGSAKKIGSIFKMLFLRS